MSTLLGLVLVAAVHQWLGSPLGPLWAAELWSLVKSGVFIVPVYWGLAARVRDHNTRVEALYADHRAASLPPPPSHHPAAPISAASHPAAERLTDGRRAITRPVLLPPSASTSRAIVVVEPDHEEE